MEIKQYQVVLVNLDPIIGSEIKKTIIKNLGVLTLLNIKAVKSVLKETYID